MNLILQKGDTTIFRLSGEVDSYITVHSNGNLTMVGEDAWRLYSSLCQFRFLDNREAPRVTLPVSSMRHLLEYATPCDDVRPQLELALRVEAALLDAELDWPHFTCGPVALRLASDLPED